MSRSLWSIRGLRRFINAAVDGALGINALEALLLVEETEPKDLKLSSADDEWLGTILKTMTQDPRQKSEWHRNHSGALRVLPDARLKAVPEWLPGH